MVRCAGIRRDGTPCTATVDPPQRYCWWHDPAHAEQRSRASARGGRAKRSRELPEIKQEVRDVIAGVLEGSIPRDRGAVAFQGFNTLLRAVEVERKIREADELEARITRLEELREAAAWQI